MSHDECQCTGDAPLDGLDRRQFLSRFGMGVGAMALGELLCGESARANTMPAPLSTHFPARAKRVIYLFTFIAAYKKINKRF